MHSCVFLFVPHKHQSLVHCLSHSPADLDMIQRGRVMNPPMRETQFMDVHAVHGKRADTAYYSGTGGWACGQSQRASLGCGTLGFHATPWVCQNVCMRQVAAGHCGFPCSRAALAAGHCQAGTA